MARTLVVCYSRSGTTLRVAERIAAGLGADLDRIEDGAMHAGPAGYVRGAWEALARGLPSISTRKDPRDYDRVVLGTPVWTGSISSPMRSYLFSHRQHLPRVAFFVTMAGRGAQGAIHEMKMLCGAEDAQHCYFTEHEIATHRHAAVLDTFILVLKEGQLVPAAIRASA